MNIHLTGDDPFADPKFGHALTRAIVDTIHEPFLVLNSDLRIIVASRSFYDVFATTKEETQGRFLHDLGNGQWNIPALRHFLNNIVPERSAMKEYKVVHDFLNIGQRTMLLSAREVIYANSQQKNLLLTIADITGLELLEREKERLSEQKDLMIREMKHRIANSLQLIASILILKANTVESIESKTHLEDAHKRILSIAEVEKHLHPKDFGKEVDMGEYLSNLCQSLEDSMISETRSVTLRVSGNGGMAAPTEAVSLGLITAELVINCLKHAFPGITSGEIVVTFDSKDTLWNLSVADDGVGMNPDRIRKEGLGTSIVASIARQLGATVDTLTSSKGTTISIEKIITPKATEAAVV